MKSDKSKKSQKSISASKSKKVASLGKIVKVPLEKIAQYQVYAACAAWSDGSCAYWSSYTGSADTLTA